MDCRLNIIDWCYKQRRMKLRVSTFKDLLVYKKAFALAMEIFHITKKFPQRRNMVYRTRLESPLARFVPIWVKGIAIEDMKPILSAKYLMQTWRIVKHRSG